MCHMWAESAYASRASAINPCFGGVGVAQSLFFYAVFSVLLIVHWSFSVLGMTLPVYFSNYDFF